jgi:CHU_C Type IX secretion signal domain
MFSTEHFNRMKRIFTALISTVLLATTTFAQAPANDNCTGAIMLTPTPVGGTCPTTIYTNVSATDAPIGAERNPDCFNGLKAYKDVWFKFRTTTGSNVNNRITIKGVNAADSIKNPQVALYVGDCTAGLIKEFCVSKEVTAADANGITVDAGCMRPNTDYYIQVAAYKSNDVGGRFTVCVEPIDPIYFMRSTPQTTSACLGTLYDSGKSTGNYGNNENNWTFNIRPEGKGCIEITVDSFSTEANVDTLTIYDGRTGVLLDKISGLTNRKIVFQAPTDWVRVVFKSDISVFARGFKLTWTSSLACSAPIPTSCSAPEIIPSLPFVVRDATNCNDAISTITTSPCVSSAGGQCVSVVLSKIPPFNGGLGTQTGINVGLYRNCPSGSNSECVATGKLNNNRDSSVIKNVSLTLAGDYYLVVSSREACTTYDLKMDTISCLNSLPNAGFCSKALSLSDCSTQGASDVILDLSTPGDGTFMSFGVPPSINAGCILNYGIGIPAPRNFTFLYFKAQTSGKFGFTVAPIIPNNNTDIDFNLYGPIDNLADICTFSKTNAPARSTFAPPGASPGPSGSQTGMADSYRDALSGITIPVGDNYDCDGGDLGDGIVRRMDVVQGKYYLIWINDYSGTIGRDGVRLNFAGTTPGVLDSVAPTAQFLAGRDTALCIGGSTQLSSQGGISYKWTPAVGLTSDNVANPRATPSVSTTYNVAIQGTCRVVGKKVEVLVFNVKDMPNQTVCRNEELVFNAGEVYPTTAGAVWSWASATNNLSELSCTNCPTPTFRATGAAGVHTFTAILTTPSCVLSKTVNITVTGNAVPNYQVITSATPTRDTNVCSGQPFNLLKFGFDTTAIYTWTSNPVAVLSGNNPSVAPSQNIKYYVSVTGGVGGCAAVSTDSVIVNVFQAPLLNLIGDTALCRDLVITLGNTAIQANTTYTWNNTTGFDNPASVNPKLTVRTGVNTYTLTAKNLGKCEVSKTVVVTGIDLRMSINGADTVRICRGTPLNLATTIFPSNARIKWSSNRDFTIPIDSTTSSITVNPITRSRYYAQVSSGNCSRIDSVNVLVDSVPNNRNILPKDTTVCTGTLVVFRSAVYEPVLYPNLKFKWTPRFGAITPDSFYNLVISADSTRTYTRTGTNGACVVLDTVKVIVNQIPTLILSPKDTSMCEPANPVRMTVTTPNQNVTDYKWKINGQDASASDGKMFLVLTPTPGITNITITAKIGDCPASASTTIRVNPSPSVAFPPPPANIVCVGGSLVLNLLPNAGFSYVWSGPGITTPTAAAPVVSPTVDNSKYVVTITNTSTRCTKTDSMIARVASGTLLDIPNTDICSGNPNKTITAVGTDNIGNGRYAWSPTGTTGASISVPSTVTAIYTVTYTFGNNCTLTKTARVNSVPGFFLRITPDSFTTTRLIDQGTPITLTANGTGNTGSGLTYAWTADNAAVGTTQTITFKANQDATYKVTGTAPPPSGCVKDTSVRLTIRYPNYQVPNAFTPNGDTINSHFNIIFNGLFPPSATNPRPDFWKGRIEVISFQVYNRWGQEVYGETSSAVLNAATYKGWNGKKNGKEDGTELASDVYVYLIKLKMPDDTIKTESGELNLIR